MFPVSSFNWRWTVAFFCRWLVGNDDNINTNCCQEFCANFRHRPVSFSVWPTSFYYSIDIWVKSSFLCVYVLLLLLVSITKLSISTIFTWSCHFHLQFCLFLSIIEFCLIWAAFIPKIGLCLYVFFVVVVFFSLHFNAFNENRLKIIFLLWFSIINNNWNKYWGVKKSILFELDTVWCVSLRVFFLSRLVIRSPFFSRMIAMRMAYVCVCMSVPHLLWTVKDFLF